MDLAIEQSRMGGFFNLGSLAQLKKSSIRFQNSSRKAQKSLKMDKQSKLQNYMTWKRKGKKQYKVQNTKYSNCIERSKQNGQKKQKLLNYTPFTLRNVLSSSAKVNSLGKNSSERIEVDKAKKTIPILKTLEFCDSSSVIKKMKHKFNHSSREFYIRGISVDHGSRIDDDDMDPINFQNNPNWCTVILSKKRRSEQSYRIAVDSIENFIQSLNRKIVLKQNQILTGYQSIPTNIVLDYYLTLSDHQKLDLKFLNQTQIVLKPLTIADNSFKLSINSFEIIKCIGTGGFSKVFLVKFKQDGKFYAMKIIQKKFIVKHKKKKIVMHQRNIMSALRHPFIVEMKFAFQSKDSLIFVMQYCPGGQLFGLVKKCRAMSQQVAKFYVIEILLGLEHIHKNNIVYRDFKPENILIDIDGHVRIADFGLAKPDIKSSKTKAYSFCGSPEYMPPEMIMKKGHSFPVDFYCLGALLYELVTGLPPFYSRNPDEIYDGTLNKPISFPRHAQLSSQLKSLIQQLLHKDENQRLGSLAGVKQVLCHPWFGKISKQDYLNKKIEPPIKFTEFADLQQIFYDIEKANKEQSEAVSDTKREQQKENIGNFTKIMQKFDYDYRLDDIFQSKAKQTTKHSNKSNKQNENIGSNRNYKDAEKKKKSFNEKILRNQSFKKNDKLSNMSIKSSRNMNNRSQTSLLNFRKQKNQLSARCLNIINFLP